MASADDLLAEAAEINASDPDRALALRRQVAAGNPSIAWSKAHMDLASKDFDNGDYAGVIAHAKAVLSAPASAVDPGAQAVAGVMLCGELSSGGQAVDEALLAASTTAAEANNLPYYAGLGFNHIARLHLARGERDDARSALERAADLFERARSLSAASVLLRLAELDLEDSNREDARSHLDRGLAWLSSFPVSGKSLRLLRDKLQKLSAQVP